MTTQFAQGIDTSRPHTLLTSDVTHSGSLLYRYDDTQEMINVPNIWYNQPFQVRVAVVRFEAKDQDERAARLAKFPQPHDLSPAAVAAIVERFHARAARIRAEADKMEAAGDPARPVAASQIELDYGENVFS